MEEEVICVATRSLWPKSHPQTGAWPWPPPILGDFPNIRRWPDIIIQRAIGFPRKMAEKHEGFKQIIPYTIIEMPNRDLVVYERAGSEKRLEGQLSIGVGGHIQWDEWAAIRNNYSAPNLMDFCRGPAEREISEELPVWEVSTIGMEFLGFVNDQNHEVGRFHLGIVFLAQAKKGGRVDRGEIKNLRFEQPENLSGLEPWSELALKLYNERNDT